MQISRSFTHTFSHTHTYSPVARADKTDFLRCHPVQLEFPGCLEELLCASLDHSWSFAAERIYSPCTGCQIDPLNHPFRLQKHSQYIIHQHQSITKTSAVLPDQVESSPFAQSCSCHLITHLSDLNVLLLSPRFCNPNLLSQRHGFP